MKKSSFVVGGLMLLAALFTTSCEEMMSKMDNPVSSYLTVSESDVVLNLDTVYQIKVETINSDNPVTYKSSDKTIATVDANGLVTPVGNKEGDIEITVAVAASAYYQAGEQKVKIAVKQPLTFEALEDGQIYLGFYNDITLEKPIVITTNRKAKKEYTSSATITVKKGDKLQFESANDHTGDYFFNGSYYTNRYVNIMPQSKCAVYGNVMSMITPDGNYHTNKTITQPYALQYLLRGYSTWTGTGYDYKTVAHDKYKLVLPATTLADYCYYYMLSNTGITEAPELPAKKMANYCYGYMFSNCRNMTKAPQLSSLQLANYCYYNMFSGCTSLKAAPALPATKLANSCYWGMFQNCSSLTETPELKAESLPYACYEYMFRYCYKLSKVTCLAKEMTNTYALYRWLQGAGTDQSVTSRTLVRNTENNNWFNSDSYLINAWAIPTGWTISPAID